MPNRNSTVESDELLISRQHLLFLNSTSMGLKGNVMSNGLTKATPLPMMVFLGVKVVLHVFNAAKRIPVHPSKILTLFLATIGMEICCMKGLLVAYSCHADKCAKDVLPSKMSYGHSESQTKTLIWMVWLSNFNGSSIQKCDSIVPPPVCMV